MNTLIEINSKFTNVNIYSDQSLSYVVADLEAVPGIVLVTQPNYNEIEAYIDTKLANNLMEQAKLEARIAKLFRDHKIPVDYVRY
jgi:hypothetical protein